MEPWHLALSVGVMVASAGAVYGGIRADLRNMKETQKDQGEAIRDLQVDGCGVCKGRRRGDKTE